MFGCDLKMCSDPACFSAMGDLIVDRAGLTLYAGMTQFHLDGCHDVIFLYSSETSDRRIDEVSVYRKVRFVDPAGKVRCGSACPKPF